MTWGAIGGAAIGAVGSYASQKSGQAPGFGGGMDYFNKVARQPMIDTLEKAKGIYSQPAINELMQQGFDAAGNIQQTLSPYLGYGNAMLNAGGLGMLGQAGGAQALMGFDPTKYNATFQAGGAYGPQYDQGTYQQVMGNAQGAINPMLQQIAAMNNRTFNEQQMPGMAANAIGSGNTASSKWGLNNAVLARGVADANANAATQLYGNAFQQAAGMGGQYGLSMADAINAAMRQNTALGNQLNFQQAGNNAQLAMQGLARGTDAYGRMVDQTSPYWQGMMDTQMKMPAYLTQLGVLQRNAPADWLQMQQDAISNVGNAGTGGASSNPGGGGYNYGNMLLGALQGAKLGGSLFGGGGTGTAGAGMDMTKGGGWGSGGGVDSMGFDANGNWVGQYGR